MDKQLDEWIAALGQMPNRERRLEIAKCIANADEFDEKSRAVWRDTVDYVEKLIDQDKLFDIDLYKAYIDLRGHDKLDGQQMEIIMTLLAMCGYNMQEIDQK